MESVHFVISSQVSLVRNVSGYPFPSRLRDNRMRMIESSVFEAVNSDGRFRLLPSNKNVIDLSVLADRAKISNGILSSDYASVIASADESEIISINDENHITISVFASGDAIRSAYEKADKIDGQICAKVKYAYSEKLGYLTASPTTLGTGMRVSVQLFLPGLEKTGNMQEIARLAAKANLRLSQSKNPELKNSSIYKLSSIYTLGVTEEDIITRVSGAVEKIGELEEKAREEYFKHGEAQIKDAAMRSYGILTNCYLLSYEELRTLCASVRLGAYYKVIAISDLSVLDRVAQSYSDNAVISERKGLLKQSDIDAYRALKVKEAIKSL